MGDSSGRQPDEPEPGSRNAGLLRAFASPRSYGIVVLLILVTYGLSAALNSTWIGSVVVAVQVATVWVSLRASQAHRSVRLVTNAALAVATVLAVANLLFHNQIQGGTVVSLVSCALYFIAPLSIVRHLIRRRVVDSETLLGAVAAYLMVGMFFAFLYHSVGLVQEMPPFFGSRGIGTFPQDLFFSFTTLTTTGYGDLIPAGNPGQTFAVAEMLTGQLFLVTAVGKVVSDWRPGRGRGGLSGGDLGPQFQERKRDDQQQKLDDHEDDDGNDLGGSERLPGGQAV